MDEKKLGYFACNVVDLGNPIPAGKYMELMNPNIQNPHKFIWPLDRQFRLRGKIPPNEMKRPIMLNKDGTPCFLVLKRGRTTDMTYGIGTEIFSVTRTHIPNGPTFKAKEWPIMPYSKESGAFSAVGDSGAVVFDVRGRMGGLLTAGAEITDTTDITYVTPMEFLQVDIEATLKRKITINVKKG